MTINNQRMVRGCIKCCLATLAMMPAGAQAITVEPYGTVDNLISALLAPGFTPVPGTASVSEDQPNMIGYFSGGADSVGFDQGVLLTTGSIFNAPGPNTSGSASGGGAQSSISFSFVANSPGISWNYVFGSEEYEEYVNSSFNDIFSLSVNGVNIALIPGTSDTVAINSVNQFLNTEYYRSNTNGAIDLQYDGLTTVLKASLSGLVPGEEYDISFLITDVGDSAFDSGVFIESGSVAFDGATFETPLLPDPPVPGGDTTAPWVFPEVFNPDPVFVWWYDPDVAIGYIYNVANPTGPLFDQYTAPALPFNVDYELYSSGDGGLTYDVVMATIFPNTPYDFISPLASFAIKGINTDNMLDPLDQTVFVAGISFDQVGLVSVTQTPIVQFVPDVQDVPGPLPILGIGAAFGWSRKLRRRQRQLVSSAPVQEGIAETVAKQV